MTIMNELRQYVSCGLVRGRLFLAVLELLSQVFALMLELLGHLFLHSRCYFIFEDLSLPATPLATNLQQVCRNTLLSYISQLGVGGSQEGSPQLSSLKELT